MSGRFGEAHVYVLYVSGPLREANLFVFYVSRRLWEAHLHAFYVSGRPLGGRTSNEPNSLGGSPREDLTRAGRRGGILDVRSLDVWMFGLISDVWMFRC